MAFGFSGFDISYHLFEIIFAIAFLLIIGTIIVSFAKGINTWHKNNTSPRLTVTAAVVSKRMDISHHSHPNAGDATGAHGYSTSTSTKYYAAFQVESGDRIEFCVSGSEYGMLAEGDTGRLSFQGTRYLSFERT